jgi:cytochrome c oxidase subunit 3
MYLYIGATLMIFAGLTSAIIVSRADWLSRPGGWSEFYSLPQMFTYSTLVVLLSSVSAQWGFYAAKRAQFNQLNLMLFITLVLGLLFLTLQVMGFRELIDKGIFLVGQLREDGVVNTTNPSGSFLYVIAFLHALHLIGALVALVWYIVVALRGRIQQGKLVGLEMCVTFWHALGFLWLYLFVFLTAIYDGF